MKNSEKNALFIRSVYEAALEILGASETESILNAMGNKGSELELRDDPLVFLSRLENEFIIRYHRNTAQGLLLRIGEAVFAILRRYIAPLQELGNLENRLKPISLRFQTGIESLAEILTEYSGVDLSSARPDETVYCLVFESESEDSFPSDLYLYFFLGLLRAFGNWMDSRKDYWIEVRPARENQTYSQVCFTYSDFE